MASRVDERIARLFDDAQGRRSLVTSSSAPECKALRRRVGKGELVEVLRGLFVRVPYWESLDPGTRALHVMRALQELHPRWVFCGPSAAIAYGLPVSWHHVATTHVAGARSSKSTVRGVSFHRLDACEPVAFSGLLLAPFWRTVFDCATALDFPDALAVLDGAARLSGASGAQIADRFRASYAHHPGVGKAVRAARFADGRSESGGESIARATFIELGFEVPELQVRIADPLEPWREFRVDGFWFSADGIPVFFELDGMGKSEDPRLARGRSKERVLAEERVRESLLTYYGARVLRVTYPELFDRRRLASKLDRFGVPRCDAGCAQPPRLKTSRAYFDVYDGLKLLVTEEVA